MCSWTAHYKVREDGRILSRATYVVLGVTAEVHKEILSITVEAVYNAPNEVSALSALENIKEMWGRKYPYAISNWENNWEDVSPFFQLPDDIRWIMYTTNIIEGLNRQYQKVTKTKSVFPSDTSLVKMLSMASRNVTKKWTQRYQNWDQVLNQLTVLYGERLTEYL